MIYYILLMHGVTMKFANIIYIITKYFQQIDNKINKHGTLHSLQITYITYLKPVQTYFLRSADIANIYLIVARLKRRSALF